MKSRIAYLAGLLGATGLGAISLAGCPENVMTDAGGGGGDAPIILEDTGMVREDAGRDAATRRDTGPTCGTPGNLGGACAAGECFDPLICQDEIANTITSVRRSDGMPGRPLTINYYPGGVCEQACDPNANNQCNGCSTCLQTGTDASGNALGGCFWSCEQDVDGRGGCNEGYGCDRGQLACVPSCQIVDMVDTCQFTFDDHDDNPATMVIVYDEGASYPNRCNVATGLCESTGRAGATAGDDCDDEFDCEDDGFCIQSDPTDPVTTLSDGYCIRVGCNETDLACQTGDVCTQSLFGLAGGVCADGCSVGAETSATQRLGAAGGNPGCGTNEACFWDGVHGTADTLNGACYLGNYNDTPAYNVGEECQDDDDCFSPYGLGRCLFTGGDFFDRTGRGICVIGGCGQAMGMPLGLRVSDGVIPVPSSDELCQTGAAGGVPNNDICVGFSETTTFCVSGCTAASDCPTGYACPNLGDALRPLRICWPACQENADCNTGAMCRNERGAACNPMTDTCFCSDAIPAPDAGPVRDAGARDAGSDAPSAAPDAPMTDDAFTP